MQNQHIKAFSIGGCENIKTPYDETYCVAKLFVESDKELNQTYTQLRDILNDEQKRKLKTVQRKWISFRDNSCSTNGTINVYCNYNINKKRIEFFQDRARECKVGNCRNDLLTQETF